MKSREVPILIVLLVLIVFVAIAMNQPAVQSFAADPAAFIFNLIGV